VLLSGASGFLGSALVRELHGRGARIHATFRSGSRIEHLTAFPIQWHLAELEDATALHAAFQSAGEEARSAGRRFDAINSAALISYRRADVERSRRVNVEGTHNVLEAALHSGVQRLCHISSVVACGHATRADRRIDEEHPFNGAGLRSAYVTTKRGAEVLALAMKTPPEVVVCLPGAIFGPSPAGSNTTRLLRRIEKGTLGPFAPPGSLSVVGVGCVARGVCLALERGRPGRRYLLCESNLRHVELFWMAASALGVRGPRRTFHPLLWRLVTGVAGLLDRLVPAQEATPEALRLLGTHFRFDASRARKELGWQPRPFSEVLEETVSWMRRSSTES